MSKTTIHKLIKRAIKEASLVYEGPQPCQPNQDCKPRYKWSDSECKCVLKTSLKKPKPKSDTKSSSSTSPGPSTSPKACYRIDASGCIKCPPRECNKKTTPCKYRTLSACRKGTAGSMNEKRISCKNSKDCPKMNMCKRGNCIPFMPPLPNEKGGSPKSRKKVKEATVTADNTKFNLRTGVNKNPTKLGIKIQFEPKGGALDSEVKSKLEVALQEKLNLALAEYDIQVSKDTDVPRDEVIGFFIPLSQLKNLIIAALTGKSGPKPTVPAPTPMSPPRPPMSKPSPPSSNNKDKDLDEVIDEMINEHLLSEMRVRDLNEISKVVIKEDFYEFINKGNNILRTLEKNGRTVVEAKKYLKYLVAHNIM